MSTQGGFILSTAKGSDFHQNCVPKAQQAAVAAAAASSQGGKVISEAESGKANVVRQDLVWKEAVLSEKNQVKEWEDNWGFLKEFDPMGRQKPPKELPDKVTSYSESVPNTASGEYGSRLNTDEGQKMRQLDFLLGSHNRKKKLGSDLACY